LTEQILALHKTGVQSLELIPSGGGFFEVSKNGDLIFSKRQSGRFPEWTEIRGALEAERAGTGNAPHPGPSSFGACPLRNRWRGGLWFW
jgi:selenoprotein W-related protein